MTPARSGVDVEGQTTSSRSGTEAAKHEENIVEALAMFIEFCNTSEGAVVMRAKDSAHALAAQVASLTAVVDDLHGLARQRGQALAEIEEYVVNADAPEWLVNYVVDRTGPFTGHPAAEPVRGLSASEPKEKQTDA